MDDIIGDAEAFLRAGGDGMASNIVPGATMYVVVYGGSEDFEKGLLNLTIQAKMYLDKGWQPQGGVSHQIEYRQGRAWHYFSQAVTRVG